MSNLIKIFFLARRLIHGGPAFLIPPEIVSLKPLLDQAPCEGPWNLTSFNGFFVSPNYSEYEWSSDTRIEHPERRGDAFKNYDINGFPHYYDIIKAEYNGLDYMLYHNLWYLYKSTFIGSNQVVHDLSDRTLDNSFTLPAAGSIDVSEGLSSSGNGSHANPATIGAFETLTASNSVLSSADVTYRAGKNLHFTNGFNVQAGATFHAYIQPYRCSFNGAGATYSRQVASADSVNAPSSYLSEDMYEHPTHQIAYSDEVLNYKPPHYIPDQAQTSSIQNNLNTPTPDFNQAVANAIQKSSLDQATFKVIPNPSNGVFKISLPSTEKKDLFSFWIYDMTGKIILSKENTKINAGAEEIDMTQYSAGNYLLRVVTSSGKQYKASVIVK